MCASVSSIIDWYCEEWKFGMQISWYVLSFRLIITWYPTKPRPAPEIVSNSLKNELGWQYDSSGKVAHIPALLKDRKIPANAKTERYPVREFESLIWVYPNLISDLKKAAANTSNGRLQESEVKIHGKNDAKVDVDRDDDGEDESKLGIPELLHLAPLQEYDGPNCFTVCVDLDIDHSLMCENLMDPSHIPFTHDGTIGRRNQATPLKMELEWTSTSLTGRMSRPEAKVERHMDTRFTFIPPCHIQLSTEFKPGWIFAQTMHCVPLTHGYMRLIYRQNRSFLTWIDKIPGMSSIYTRQSRKIVFQDYELLHGQQDRLDMGAKPWNAPIQVDTLPKYYRDWWKKAMYKDPYFKGYSNDLEDLSIHAFCNNPCFPDPASIVGTSAEGEEQPEESQSPVKSSKKSTTFKGQFKAWTKRQIHRYPTPFSAMYLVKNPPTVTDNPLHIPAILMWFDWGVKNLASLVAVGLGVAALVVAAKK